MDSIQGWKIQPQDNASGTIHLIEGPGDKAIEMDYNLGVNSSFAMSKRMGLSKFGEDISKLKKIGFIYKANGTINSLEFELVDQDGKCFGKKWLDVTGTVVWTVLEVQIPNLKCWGCNCKDENEIVDLNKVVSFGFAVSDKAGEEGGAGEVTINEIIGFY